MFFSFEGIDGSGKSTQARLLAAALRQRGHEVVEVREPGGTVLGEQIRALLLDPASHIDPRAELLLFSAARAQLVTEVIRPALDRRAVVIADRFFDSSTAYQGGGRGIADPTWMATLHAFATSGVQPGRTYLIDVDLPTAAGRRGPRDPDRMELGGDAYYRRIRVAYRELAAMAPARILQIDGADSVEDQHRQILQDALPHLRA